MRGRFAVPLVLAVFAVAAAPARAQAPADSSFGQYLESLRDSTNIYFGRSVAPVDTAGLDSVLAERITKPGATRHVAGTWRLSAGPWLGFNRVDGPLYGATLGTGRERGLGRFVGRAGYAVGSDTWLGSGGYTKARRHGLIHWTFGAEAGRLTASMDRERDDLRLASLRAFLSGSDSRRYLRHDGLELQLDARHPAWRGQLGYRDMLESPLGVTARWSLFRADLSVADNLAAAPGHAHELSYLLGARTPYLPFTAEAQYWTSGDKIGSDFEYRRTRLSLGGDIALGRAFTLVPQFSWGRLSGQPLPQEAFYLGGIHSLRSLEGAERGGTGLALAKLDLLELPDLLELLRIPHPAMLPIQAGAFIASGAVWGADPYGGRTRPGIDWPNRQEFLHEAGVSMIYRPGIPDPSAFMSLMLAWPIGNHAAGPRFSVSYTRGVDLVRRIGEDEEP